MKTYVLTVSRNFPKTHKRAGDRTFFPEMILTALMGYEKGHGLKEKLHTIRANYELWKKREKEIIEGKAILSIRHWSEKPYRSKQVEICKLDKIGVQQITVKDVDNDGLICSFSFDASTNICHAGVNTIARNDGLSPNDFKEWFKNYDLSEPMAIIHFTDFRY